MEKITDKSVIFKAVEVGEESHDAQDLPLPLNQVAEKFASEHKGEGEVTIVTGFLESLHLSQNQCIQLKRPLGLKANVQNGWSRGKEG